jgi:peptide-methionine (S)-S-oxide reductase
LLTRNSNEEFATLAGGCFWCLEPLFNDLKGVINVESGYSGGNIPNPSYQEVCDGITGHTEVVHIEFDPQIISYLDLLNIFFTIHDPTTLNRQGQDVGTQYRSSIFYHSPEQKITAKNVIGNISREKIWKDKIVTEIVPFKKFYRAEDYHQKYYQLNPNQTYCRVVIEPKVIKFRKKNINILK